jgi:pimeloyl-ACP methyl ester carboxylesterase
LSSIVTTEGIVHYEMDGRGEPVVLLHGWINSWDVWSETMIHIASGSFAPGVFTGGVSTGGARASTGRRPTRFKVYALDFWGFGESANGGSAGQDGQPYKLDAYVSMVDQFMEIMGIQRAPIIGHSMGGTVALKMALEHPERVGKTVIVGSPIVGDSLNYILQLGGRRWIADTLFRVPLVLRMVIWYVLSGDSARVKRMILRDVSRTSVESFFRSIEDLHRTNLSQRMGEISMPTLGIFGQRDNVVDPGQADVLRRCVPHARVQMMPRSRHFPMVDEPGLFRQTVLSFLLDSYANE